MLLYVHKRAAIFIWVCYTYSYHFCGIRYMWVHTSSLGGRLDSRYIHKYLYYSSILHTPLTVYYVCMYRTGITAYTDRSLAVRHL